MYGSPVPEKKGRGTVLLPLLLLLLLLLRLLQTLVPCCPPRHAPPHCHPAARAQSGFPLLREAAFGGVQKEHPPPRARFSGALGLRLDI